MSLKCKLLAQIISLLSLGDVSGTQKHMKTMEIGAEKRLGTSQYVAIKSAV